MTGRVWRRGRFARSAGARGLRREAAPAHPQDGKVGRRGGDGADAGALVRQRAVVLYMSIAGGSLRVDRAWLIVDRQSDLPAAMAPRTGEPAGDRGDQLVVWILVQAGAA